MATRNIDIIKMRTSTLSKEEKIQLIEFLTEGLKNGGSISKPLQFGKYQSSGKQMSTDGDFQDSRMARIRSRHEWQLSTFSTPTLSSGISKATNVSAKAQKP